MDKAIVHGERSAVSTSEGARPADAMVAAFFESALDAIVIVDDAGAIVRANARTETLFAYTRGELIGLAFEKLVPANEASGIRKDGSRAPIDVRCSRFRAGGRELTSFTIRDVIEQFAGDEQRLHLAAMVEASDDAIIGKTLDGIVTSWNGGAERLFGYSADEMIGQPLARLIPDDRRDEETLILEHLASGRVERFDTIRLRKDGRAVDVSVTSSPIRDSSGRLVGAVKVARDITARRHVEEALARAKEAAEAATCELEAFSYSVAHDLRAPLRGMNGFAQLLRDAYGDVLDAEGKDWLDEICSNASAMGALIDALLSLARLTRSELRREVVDLSAIAREIASELAAAEATRNVAVVVADGLSASADPALARSLLQNLVGNAWKFTANRGDARIEVGATTRDGVDEIFVRDNGAGFDMAFAGKMFAPFQRLHRIDEFPGTGIGLATVQRIVHRHGGRIRAEGEVGKGATFRFTLPALPSGAPT